MNKKILKKYAELFVCFGINDGKGMKNGDTVLLSGSEAAREIILQIRRTIVGLGGNVIMDYYPDTDNRAHVYEDLLKFGNDKQLGFFPEKYYKGLLNSIDHHILIDSQGKNGEINNKYSHRMALAKNPFGKFKSLQALQEHKGAFSWTAGIYPTNYMAKSVGLNLKDYTNQIIKACYLDKKDPIKYWKAIKNKIEDIKSKLNNLKIEKIEIKSKDCQLFIPFGLHRKWIGGPGRNIPSYEVFMSPDYRGVEGYIKFNIPLSYEGILIEDIYLKFEDGKVIEANSRTNKKVLKNIIRQKGGDQIGEFSLTDKNMSRIDKRMGHILYDENIGGRFGNMHIALGNAYLHGFDGDLEKFSKDVRKQERLGFNKSTVHVDIVSTVDRLVTAHLKGGSVKVIYKNGSFCLS